MASIFILSWLGPLIGLLDKAFGNISLPTFNIGLLKFFSKHGKLIPYLTSGTLALYGGISYFILDSQIGLFNLGLGGGLLVWSKYSSYFFKHAFKTTYKPPTPQQKNPSVFKEYMKAKHHSVCPTLQFVDVEKEEFNEDVKKIAVDTKAVMPEIEKIMELAESNDISQEATEEIINTTGKLLEKADKHDLYPDEK